jgi:hypothetical protein
MERDDQPEETPDAFLKALGESLSANADVDQSVANILAKNILKGAPDANAVSQAKDAILKLAAERAAPSNPAAVDG